MVSTTRIPNILRGDLAQQSLWLRLGLILLFAVVALWVSGPHYLLGAVILAYTATSAMLALGHRVKVLGSSDVIYAGMVDTSLFLGAGVVLTGGPQSPVLFLFFGLQAAFLVLATPRTFIISASLSAASIIAAVLLSMNGLVPAGISPQIQPLTQIIAASGALAMLALVGSRHSITFVGSSQAKQHLNAALSAFRRMVRNGDNQQMLASVLSNLMTALKITEEGAIYRYRADTGTLKLEVGLGLKPWLQKFPELNTGEGPIGAAFQNNRRVICEERKQLGPYLRNLSPKNAELLNGLVKKHTPPSYAAVLPLKWQDEPLGVLLVSRHEDILDDNELQLMEGMADHLASAMHQSTLTDRVTRLEKKSRLDHQLKGLEKSATDPAPGIGGFAQELKRMVSWDCARLLSFSGDDLEPGLCDYWSSADLDRDLPTLDEYLKDLLQNHPPGSTLIGFREDEPPECLEGAITGQLPPALAEQGINCVLGVTAEVKPWDGPPVVSILALMYQSQETDSHDPEAFQLVQASQPCFHAAVARAAAALHLDKTGKQVESLCGLISLSHGSGEEEQITRGIIQGVSRLLDESSYLSVAVLQVNDETGAVGGISQRCSLPEQFQPLAVSEHTADLKNLFHEWGEPEVKVFIGGGPEGAVLCELTATPEDASLLGFPLHTPEKTFGVVVVQLTARQTVSYLEKSLIKRVVEVGGLCLQNFRSYEAQARQVRELQQEDELRRSFLSYITHEFRTPLASLKTSFELIQEAEEMRGLDDPYQRLLTNVNRSIAVLDQLVSDMSEVANLSAGGVVLNKTLTSPEAIIYPVVETTSPLSHLKSQTMEVEIQPDLPQMMADAHRLEQVLTNMVSNAIKYTPRNGSIKTVVSQENGCIQFAVSDTGRGIPPDDLDKVFDPFYRVQVQSADRTPGTGLGLALAKSLVELHGGKIWVSSESQKGSTFYFTIPLESRN